MRASPRCLNTASTSSRNIRWKRSFIAASLFAGTAYIGTTVYVHKNGKHAQIIKESIPTISQAADGLEILQEMLHQSHERYTNTTISISHWLNTLADSTDSLKLILQAKIEKLQGFFKKEQPHNPLEKPLSEESPTLAILQTSSDEAPELQAAHQPREPEYWKMAELKQFYEEKLAQLKIELENRHETEKMNLETEIRKSLKKEAQLLVETERGSRLGKLALLESKLKLLEVACRQFHSAADERKQLLYLFNLSEMLQEDLVNGDISMDHLQLLCNSLMKFPRLDNFYWNLSDLIPKEFDLSSLKCKNALISDLETTIPLIHRSSFVSSSFLSHLMASFFQKISFKPQAMLIPGDSIFSKLCRAKYFAQNGHIEFAARELGQLSGWSQLAAQDWLTDARNYLLVKMILDCLQSQLRMQSINSL